MAVITPDRFDPIKAFCSVRLQQGVPLVDADVNELDDIRKFEVRAFLKWFVGDGVPDGNDGFRIDALATPAPDDIQIRVGAQSATAAPGALGPALRSFGRCIVDGLDVIIQRDTTYKGQPNFTAATVDPIPNVAGPVLVYIDVWERLVTAQEDPSLIVPPLGTESCARLKREWVVRARQGADVPADGDADFQRNHSYYGLARVNRRMDGGNPAPILPSDITDLRERGLVIAPSTLIADVIGGDVEDYRRGLNRPVISLREAINALLRNEVPATVEEAIAPSGTGDDGISYAFVSDPAGGVNALWASTRTGSQHIFAARWDPENPGAGFTLPAQPQVTSGPGQFFLPHAAVLPTGDILAVYTISPNFENNVVFKRATHVASLGAAAEQPIIGPSETPGNLHPYVVVVPDGASGGVVVFFYASTTPGGATARWMYRRRRYQAGWAESTATWLDAGGVVLGPPASIPAPSIGGLRTATTSDGNVWIAYESQATQTGPVTCQPVRLDVTSNALLHPPVLSPAGVIACRYPHVLIDQDRVVWVFFTANTGTNNVHFQRYTPDGAPVGGLAVVPGTVGGFSPTAALDAQNGLWLFFRSPERIFYMRWNPSTSSWGAPRPLPDSTGSWGSDVVIFVMRGPNGALWLFRQRSLPGERNNVLFRQFVTAI